jgi:hypothetical protein
VVIKQPDEVQRIARNIEGRVSGRPEMRTRGPKSRYDRLGFASGGPSGRLEIASARNDVRMGQRRDAGEVLIADRLPGEVQVLGPWRGLGQRPNLTCFIGRSVGCRL